MIETLGNIGDFVGGLAVVVTLAYLAMQVRQNTRALHAASRQQIVDGFRSHNRLFFENGAPESFSLGMRSYPNMPRERADLFGTMQTDHAVFLQGAFALHEAGTLERETFDAYLDYFSATVSTPGGANWWSEMKLLYPPRMVRAIDGRVERADVPDLLSLDAFGVPPAA